MPFASSIHYIIPPTLAASPRSLCNKLATSDRVDTRYAIRSGVIIRGFRVEYAYRPTCEPSSMAKMNSFFIRAQVNAGNANAFAQSEIDIGSYTDLGSSSPELLRIHNVTVSMTDSGGEIPLMTGDTGASAAWQLTTQSQTALVLIDDRSFVSGGRGSFRNPDSAITPPSQAFESQVLPQEFTQGYLVAVPTLYLGGLGGNNFTEDVYFTIMLECTTEKATKSNAVSLAVSQM